MTIELREAQGVRIAIEGCGHGVLHSIYASVNKACAELAWDGIDLLIIGGDFQAVRNAPDLAAMSVPAKYRDMHDFHEYYAGTREAPYLTVFIGGNHEAANHLFELFYGGWVAPNIYYLGAANVIRLGPLRIAGLSGIWKGYSYNKPHFERLPYNQDDVKSIYHVRELDVRKLLQVRTPVDIGLSHDWPRAVEMMGDHERLFRQKPDFRADSQEGRLGSVAARYVLDRLRPRYWFSAHLHCKFAATISHDDTKDETSDLPNGGRRNDAHVTGVVPAKNTDELDLDMDDDDDESTPAVPVSSIVADELRAQLPAAFARPQAPVVQPVIRPPAITNTTTRFLALDKCLKNRDFLQLLAVDGSRGDSAIQRPLKLEYDPEWLAICRVFGNELVVGQPDALPAPNKGEAYYLPLIQAEEEWVKKNLVEAQRMTIPENFTITAPVYDPRTGLDIGAGPREYTNNQTVDFCNMLDIANPFDIAEEERIERQTAGPRPVEERFDQSGRAGGRQQRGGHRGGRHGQRGYGHGHGHGHGRGGGRGRGRGRG